MSSIKNINKGFKPTLGGNLFLNKIKKIPAKFKPNIGGRIYFGGNIKPINREIKNIINKNQ